MPKVLYTAAKGLYQESGKGLDLDRPVLANYDNAVTVTGVTVTMAPATHVARPTVCTNSAGTTVTLPAIGTMAAIVNSQIFWIVNGAADGTLLTVSPNASDKFLWDLAGAAGTDNKAAINTAATAKNGDYIKLGYGSGDGWNIIEFGGIWADQA